MKLRRLILPLVSALAIIATPAAASAATTAHASAPAAARGHAIPFEAEGCSGDACIHVSTPSNGKVTIHGCAWKTTGTGHIQITGPAGGLPKNSSTGSWTKTTAYCTGADKYYSVTVSAVVGTYCSTTYKGSTYDGTACENVE